MESVKTLRCIAIEFFQDRSLPSIASPDSEFYAEFEARFRGSRTTVLERLAVYRPLLSTLGRADAAFSALDLGCGRGEWLELLRAEGLPAQGLDQDDAMLEPARALGLQVQKGDALEALQQRRDASETLISAFHLAEHLPFAQLQQLAIEAHRVLKPGGVLILETPNAENLVVGSSHFYLDPSHQRPLPAALLEFLLLHTGFHGVRVLRLQHNPALAIAHNITLLDVLEGVSPDIAIIGLKDGGGSATDQLTTVLHTMVEGLSLQALCTRYERNQARLQRHLQERLLSVERVLEAQQPWSTRWLRRLQRIRHRLRRWLPAFGNKA